MTTLLNLIQVHLNVARYLVLFTAGALGDRFRFDILTSYAKVQNAKSYKILPLAWIENKPMLCLS
jgi:hypothetical protein